MEAVGVGMTTKEAIHQLVDELPQDRVDLARLLLEDLANAADEDGPLMDDAALASLDRGLADITAGRVKSPEDYEHERGL